MKYWVTLLTMACGSILMSHGCGLNWIKPTNYFDGVNARGYLSHWEDWGSIQLSKEMKLPFVVGFRSNRESTSPYLGKGWTAALLESYAIPVDERRYRVMMPDGYNFKFWKDRANPEANIYKGSRGWLAEVSQDGRKFTAWAPCGTKVEWQDGKIREIITKGGNKIRYVYNGRQLTGLQDESGQELLEVNWHQPGIVKSFVLHQLDGKKLEIELEQDQKPEVQHVGGVNLIGELTNSLSQASWLEEGEKVLEKQYAFKIDEKALLPTLDILEDGKIQRSLVWNPQSRYIMKDGEWNYQIEPGKNEDRFLGSGYARISRVNTKGEQESWHRDKKSGKTITENNGVKTVRTWFTSGKLKGKIRQILEKTGGEEKTLYTASYNEHGDLVRERKDGQETARFKYVYGPDGERQKKTSFKGSKEEHVVTYDSNGNIKQIRHADGAVTDYEYDNLGREYKKILDGKIYVENRYAENGFLKQKIFYDDGGELPTRTFSYQFDDFGRMTHETISDHSGHYPDISKEYFYNELGELIKKIDSQQGTLLYEIGLNGEKITKLVNAK